MQYINENKTFQSVSTEAIKHRFVDIYLKTYEAYYGLKIELHGHMCFKGFRCVIPNFTEFANKINKSLGLYAQREWVDLAQKRGSAQVPLQIVLSCRQNCGARVEFETIY